MDRGETRPIPSCPGYSVDRSGAVYSPSGARVSAFAERRDDIDARMRVNVRDARGRRRCACVSRLVAEAWIGVPEGWRVTHRGDALDDSVENLLVLPESLMGARFVGRTQGRASGRPVLRVRPDGDVAAAYDSVAEASRDCGVPYYRAYRLCSGRYAHAFAPDGMRWIFADSDEGAVVISWQLGESPDGVGIDPGAIARAEGLYGRERGSGERG